MKDRTALEIERHTLLCSIERCRHIVGLKRDVERLKNQMASIDRQLAADHDDAGAAVLSSAWSGQACVDEITEPASQWKSTGIGQKRAVARTPPTIEIVRGAP